MNFTTLAEAKRMTGLSYIGGVNLSSKLKKNLKVSNNLTYIIYMAPASESGYNVCHFSTPECRRGCLSTSGRAAMSILAGDNRVMNARIKKSKLFMEDQDFFMDWVIQEISRYKQQAENKGYEFSVRMNGTSDINWIETKRNDKNIFEIFPDVNFYDYTKDPTRFFNLPENYHLTFSFSGRNEVITRKLLEKGHNAAVVFNVKKEDEFPKKFMGFDVINGDLTDFRPNDGQGVIVGLKWKKIANKEDNEIIKKSIFVVQPLKDSRCTF